jgi:Tfp pilus assembly protein PilP
MQKSFLTIAALVGAGTLTINAQAPQQTQPPPRPTEQATTQRTPAAADPQVITVRGCLKEEKDVAGLKPNPVERAGITEDYVLTMVKMASNSKVSGIGLAAKYEIEGIAENELKKHLNHEVELTGTITQPGTTDTDATPDFRATAIKMVAATCQAAQ